MFSFASLPRQILKNFHQSFVEILLSNNLLAKFVLCSCFAILIVLMDSFLRCLYNLHDSSVISFFRLFAWRYGAAPRRNNAKRKDEITKKRQVESERKDEITPGEKRKKRNAPREMTKNEHEKTKKRQAK